MSATTTPTPSWIIPAVLMMASTVGMLSTDLYVPSLPTLTEVFNSTPETIQLTMTLNLAGFALGQLFFGPFSDRFGRRTAMLLGLSLFCVAALGCALAWSAEALILGRILLGLTGACEAVIGMAVIKELYGEEKGVKIVAIYAMVIAAAPAIGPVIGGIMLVNFGWASNFWLLLGMALVTLAAIWRFLMETATLDPSALRPARLLAETRLCLGVPAFWLYTIGPAASLGAIFAWITEGPFVLIQQLGIPPDNFGYYQAMLVGAFFVTNLIVNRAADRVKSQFLLRLGTIAALVGAGLVLALVASDTLAAWSLGVAVSFFGISIGLIYAVAPLKALASTQAATGMAASWRGFLEMSGAMMGSAGIVVLHDGTPWPLAIMLTVCAVVILIGDIGARWADRRDTAAIG